MGPLLLPAAVALLLDDGCSSSGSSRYGGGASDDAPPVQVTDLRTLAWQMQVDGAQDWRPLLFVAPQPSIDYVQRAQEQADDAGDAPPLTRNDVMGLLFPQADAGTPNAL